MILFFILYINIADVGGEKIGVDGGRKNNRRIKIKIENYRSSKGYEGEINEWMLVA